MNIKQFFGIAAMAAMSVSTYAQKTELKAGEMLNPGEPVYSKDGKFVLIMENVAASERYGQFSTFATSNFSTDRRIVMSSVPKTNLGKSTGKAQKIAMQTDGNLAIYDYKDGTYIWDAQTHQKTADPKAKGEKMIVENDGSISVYNASGQKIWNHNKK